MFKTELVQKRGKEMKESLVLLALAALALMVAPSYPLVYGAGAVAAALVMGVPLLRSRKSTFAHRRPGITGVRCIELPVIPGDPRINPARRGGEGGASRGWKGMRRGARPHGEVKMVPYIPTATKRPSP
jgi:hypothetical protein